MARCLWVYYSDFGWFAAGPAGCDDDEDRIDTVEPLLAADTKHALLQQAEQAGCDIVMWFA
jgi:hypothetical protein